MLLRKIKVKKYFWILVYISVCLIFSCGQNKIDKSFISATYPSSKDLDKNDTKVQSDNITNNSANIEISDRKIIKNANLNFQTENIQATTAFIENLVTKMSGYIVSNNTNKNDNTQSNYLTVKVPAEKFEVFIEEISNGIKHFKHKEIYSEDVTTQFIDYTARLNVKKETEKRYIELLQKANTVTEIVEIEKNLSDLRSEIESLQGQLKYLTSQIDFSTVQISYYTKNKTASVFFSEIIKAFLNGRKLIGLFFLGIITIWPFLIVAGIILALIFYSKSKKQ